MEIRNCLSHTTSEVDGMKPLSEGITLANCVSYRNLSVEKIIERFAEHYESRGEEAAIASFDKDFIGSWPEIFDGDGTIRPGEAVKLAADIRGLVLAAHLAGKRALGK